MNSIDPAVASTSSNPEQNDDTPEEPFATSSDDPDYHLDPEEELSDSDSAQSIPRKSQINSLMNFFKLKRKNEPNQVRMISEPLTRLVKNMGEKSDDPQSSQFACSSSILDGKYFKIKENDDENITADCQLCLPQKKTIKGIKGSSSNFFKHLKRMHPNKIDEYNKYKISKKDLTRKRLNAIQDFESREPKQAKLIQPRIFGMTNEGGKSVLSQSLFEKRIINFVVSTMSAISIIEHQSFKDIFQGLNLKIPTRKTVMKRIIDSHDENMQVIKDKIRGVNYVCTTADIWSNKKRSFLGVTVHWLDEDFIRKSAALACRRFKGVHSYRSIAEMLEDINLKFGLTENKIVGTVTDNGSNFVKAFKVFGEKNEEDDDEEIDEEEDELKILHLEVDEGKELEDRDIQLPKHMRCATHTLNLIATTDYKNTVIKIPTIRIREKNAFSKCAQLWKKSNKPKSNEVIIKILGHTLSSPGATRWNSTFDAVSQILQAKEKLPILLQNLTLEPFKETELLYLEEYCLVMKPLALTLDLLQGEENVSFGYLLPSLISLINKYEKLLAQTKLKYGGEHLAKMCIKSLNTRFANILNLEWEDPIIAAVLLPKFKLKWYNVVHNPKKTLEDIKKCIITVAKKQMELESCNESDESGDQNLDDFFDFSDFRDQQVDNSCTITHNEQGSSVNNKTSKIQLELLRYLEDKRTNLHILNEYPTLKRVSTKYNTCLPSSAPVERLFSFATMIDTPKRKALSDEHFEVLVLTKANSKALL